MSVFNASFDNEVNQTQSMTGSRKIHVSEIDFDTSCHCQVTACDGGTVHFCCPVSFEIDPFPPHPPDDHGTCENPVPKMVANNYELEGGTGLNPNIFNCNPTEGIYVAAGQSLKLVSNDDMVQVLAPGTGGGTTDGTIDVIGYSDIKLQSDSGTAILRGQQNVLVDSVAADVEITAHNDIVIQSALKNVFITAEEKITGITDGEIIWQSNQDQIKLTADTNIIEFAKDKIENTAPLQQFILNQSLTNPALTYEGFVSKVTDPGTTIDPVIYNFNPIRNTALTVPSVFNIGGCPGDEWDNIFCHTLGSPTCPIDTAYITHIVPAPEATTLCSIGNFAKSSIFASVNGITAAGTPPGSPATTAGGYYVSRSTSTCETLVAPAQAVMGFDNAHGSSTVYLKNLRPGNNVDHGGKVTIYDIDDTTSDPGVGIKILSGENTNSKQILIQARPLPTAATDAPTEIIVESEIGPVGQTTDKVLAQTRIASLDLGINSFFSPPAINSISGFRMSHNWPTSWNTAIVQPAPNDAPAFPKPGQLKNTAICVQGTRTNNNNPSLKDHIIATFGYKDIHGAVTSSTTPQVYPDRASGAIWEGAYMDITCKQEGYQPITTRPYYNGQGFSSNTQGACTFNFVGGPILCNVGSRRKGSSLGATNWSSVGTTEFRNGFPVYAETLNLNCIRPSGDLEPPDVLPTSSTSNITGALPGDIKIGDDGANYYLYVNFSTAPASYGLTQNWRRVALSAF